VCDGLSASSALSHPRVQTDGAGVCMKTPDCEKKHKVVTPNREAGWAAGTKHAWTHRCQFHQCCLLNSCLPVLPLFSRDLAFKAEHFYPDQLPDTRRVKKLHLFTQTLPMKCFLSKRRKQSLKELLPAKQFSLKRIFYLYNTQSKLERP